MGGRKWRCVSVVCERTGAGVSVVCERTGAGRGEGCYDKGEGYVERMQVVGMIEPSKTFTFVCIH